MAKVGDIFVSVSGSTLGLSNAINKGIGSLNQFKIAALSMKSVLTGLAAAVAGGAIVNGIKSFVNSGLEVVDQQTKLARNIGITTQQLTELDYIAGLSGVSMATLGQSILKLGANIANGQSTLKEGLNILGLSFDEIRNKDLGSAFNEIRDTLSQIESPAKRNAVAMKLFGEEGIQIAGILNQTPEVIAEMAAESRKLGLSFSELAGQSVEAANDAIAKVHKSIQGVAQAAAIQLAPAIQAVADLTTEWLVSTRKDVDELVPSIDTIGESLAVVVLVAKSFLVVWGSIKIIALGILGVISAIVTAWAFLTGTGKQYAATLRYEVNDMANGVADTFATAFSDHTDGIQAGINKVKLRMNELTPATNQASSAINNELIVSITKANESADKLLESLGDQIDSFGLAGTELELYKLAQQGVEQATLDQIEAYNKELKLMQSKADLEKELAESAKQLKDDIASPFDTAVKKIEEIKNLFANGLINEQELEAAIDKMASTIETKKITPQFSSAAFAGSQEARSAILSFKNPVQNTQTEYQKKQYAEQKKANEYLKKISDKKADELVPLNA
ncbi:MAG: hypothetical protein R3C17_10570 [Planctomycetaceae bacterium]